ncbi:MAG: PAS domain-containing sensor histidine kinase [Saprospiraceae bacterium]|nr:PAS domain-containing sensor histidine kinase [Saprospiraceae bacterium]
MPSPEPSVLESETNFNALFQFATIGILVVNQDGRIVQANPNADKLFGYDSNEMINKSLEILLPTNLRRTHTKHRGEYFEQPRERVMGQGKDLYALRKDGTEFPVEISLSHYEFDGQRLAVAFINDITKRKQIEQNLSDLNANLEQKIQERTQELVQTLDRERNLNEMKSVFVSMASHEFRTPLSTILSSVSLIHRYIEIGQVENCGKHVKRIKNSVQSLTIIMNDFLSLDKLENGKVAAVKSMFDLRALSVNIVDELESSLKDGQNIHYMHKGDIEAFLDSKFIRIVMLNLLSNAIKYSEKDIKLNTEVDDKQISIVVEDRGIGIPIEEQKNLFGKFFRAKNAMKIQGTGLGLHIVKRYIGLLDGTVDFTSKHGEGTTFVIRFDKQVNC